MVNAREAAEKLVAEHETGGGSESPEPGPSGNVNEPAVPYSPRCLLADEEVELALTLDTWPGRFIEYARQRTDAPREFLEAAAYGGLSVGVGRKALLKLITGPVIPILWILLVADSTRYRKSTVIDLLVEVLVLAPVDALAPDDFSPQRLVNLMAERSGRPTLFRRDEFGGFYEGLNKLEHQSGGKQILIGFHDGRDYRKELVGDKQRDSEPGETRRKPEVIEVHDPFLSILAGTQRDLFLSQASHGDVFSGFLPRFAFVAPNRPPQRRDVHLLGETVVAEGARLAKELQRIWNGSQRSMYLDDGVLARWNRYTSDLKGEADTAPLPPVAGPVFDRIGHMALKVALLLAYADGDRVTMAHMLAGMEVAERWRASSYTLLAAIGPTRDEKVVQRVFDLISRKPGIKRQDVMSGLRLGAKEMDAAHNTLVQREWVSTVPAGRGVAYHSAEAALGSTVEVLERLQGEGFSENFPGLPGRDLDTRIENQDDERSALAVEIQSTPLSEVREGSIKRSSDASDESPQDQDVLEL